MQVKKQPPMKDAPTHEQTGHTPPARTPDDVTPQEFYREFASRPDVRTILERLAK